jgi:sugar/nucleoside kinase (ribokinase family)
MPRAAGAPRGGAGAAMSPDLVVLGNLLVDDVVLPDGRTRMGEPGGATLYASLAAALWGLRVGVVSLRGDDYPARALEALAGRGVDLAGVHPLGGPGVRTWLLYEGAVRRVVHRRGCPTHTEVSPLPRHLPAAWAAARAFHLAPMPLEVQRALVEHLAPRQGALVSLDPHEPIAEHTLAAWREVLASVDALFVGEDEMRLPGAAEDPAAALARLAVGRLRWIAFKRGARGGLLYDARTGAATPWRAPAAHAVDPTGAGDCFAAGVLAGLLAGEPVGRMLARGVAGTSFALEDWGPAGLLRATPAEAARRLAEASQETA